MSQTVAKVIVDVLATAGARRCYGPTAAMVVEGRTLKPEESRTLVGPGETVRIPRSTKQFDWECELAIVGRPNVFIKIPGTAERLPAIEEAIFAGVPIDVTLLFSPEQYVAAADAYLRGIERRIAAGLNPNVDSAASLFISRWDVAVAGQVPATLLYVKELIAPLTVNTVPESTLKAFADHGELGPELTSHRSSPHGTSCSMVIASKSASLAKAS
jgi:transaldolase